MELCNLISFLIACDACDAMSRTSSRSKVNSSRESAAAYYYIMSILEILEIGNLTKFDVEDGEICNMDAQTQDGSGEIQKTPTT